MRDDEKDLHRNTATTTTGTTTAEHHDANPDPLTGEAGAHPIGTGVGAASGGTVGAVIGGAVGGPLGAMVGAAVGGLAGGLAGKGISESVNPTEEDAYWRENHAQRPYAANRGYDELGPAYQYGWETWAREGNRGWNGAEKDLEQGWDKARGDSRLSWNDARNATRDAWDRLDSRASGGHATPGINSQGDRAVMGVGNYDNLSQVGGVSTGTGISTDVPPVADAPGAFGMNPGVTAESLGHPEGHTGTASQAHFGNTEDRYWREQFSSRPYAQSGRSYDDYRPAYQYGYDAAHLHQGRRWEDAESDLERGWEKARGTSHMAWQDVKDAARDAWHRVERALPGDADRDGR
jgi:hypothetical protein